MTPQSPTMKAAVLTAPDTAGTTRIDVQVPERPSASGLEQIAEQLQASTQG